MNFSEIYTRYLALVQNPFIPKSYRNLQQCYASIHAQQIVDDFEHIIKVKFNREENNANVGQVPNDQHPGPTAQQP